MGEAEPVLDPEIRSYAYNNRSIAEFVGGDVGSAVASVNQALEIARCYGKAWARAAALNNLSVYTGERPPLETSVEICTKSGFSLHGRIPELNLRRADGMPPDAAQGGELPWTVQCGGLLWPCHKNIDILW